MDFSTRLSIKMLWLKHAYRFCWAHKPLCARFTEDVLKLGPVYLCRSCTAAYAGVFAGVLLVFFAPVSSEYFPAAFLTVLTCVLIFSIPPLYKGLPRFLRDLVRFASGVLIPAGIYLCTGSGYLIGILGLAALFIFWRLYLRMRKARKLGECDGCSDLSENRICPGFVMQAEHIRKYQTEADELLITGDYVPECVPLPAHNPSKRLSSNDSDVSIAICL